ncbi:zinc-ribbon domain-containing protein [Peribacillus sp. NPDC097206]
MELERNVGLTPFDVFPNSSKKVWWICKKGHEWEARIYSRNKGN